MKKTVSFLAALFAMHSVMLAATVPATFNYQGKVSDGTNTLIGAGTSTNRKMLFRFYDAQTNGTLLWAEVQTVTIFNGEFSVLLGTGLNHVESGATQPRPPIDTVFTGAATALYLEITVAADTTNDLTTATPISPRQTIATTAFAFRAQTADRINSNSSLQLGATSDSGLGFYDSSRQFNSTSVNGPVLYGSNGGVLGSVNNNIEKTALSWNNFGKVGIGGAASNSSDGAALTLTGSGNDQLWLMNPGKGMVGIGYKDTNYGSMQALTASWAHAPLALNPHGGNVGIGITSPRYKLDVGGSIAAAGNSGYVFNSGGDEDGGLFSPADGTLVFKTNGQERMRLDPSGRLGIGINEPRTVPEAKIDIGGYVRLFNSEGRNHFKDISKTDGLGLRVGEAWGMYGIYAENANKCVVGGGGGVILQMVGATSALEVATNGKVSLGGAAMDAKLNIRDGDILFEERGQNPNDYGIRGAVSSDYWKIFGNASTPNNMALYIDSGDDGNEEIIFRQVQGTNARQRMKINSDGNVQVNDGMYAGGFGSSGSRGYSFTSGDTDGGMFSPSDGNLSFKTNNAERVWINTSGLTASNLTSNDRIYANVMCTNLLAVGGDREPHAGNDYIPLTVKGKGKYYYSRQAYLDDNGASGNDGWGTWDVSILAYGTIVGDDFGNFSDVRIKKDLKVTDSALDLSTLLGIEVTNYHFKDSLAKGTRPQKKLIAQQVEKVFPQAVNQMVGVVPDIYQRADFKDGWVELATDLKPGDRVRLIGEKDEKDEKICEVLEVAAGKFRIDFKTESTNLFVYGRQVKDFRTVDYDAISMLNVSATQELVKQLKEKDAQIAALEEKLAVQVKQDSVRDAKLAAIEKKLFGGAGGPETVSLKTGE